MLTQARDSFRSIPVRRRRLVLVGAGLLIVAVLAVAFTGTGVLSGGAEEETELQTATVRSGDLVIMASGSGTLLAEDEVKLGFGEQGTIASLHVKVGDQVQAGDILANRPERSCPRSSAPRLNPCRWTARPSAG